MEPYAHADAIRLPLALQPPRQPAPAVPNRPKVSHFCLISVSNQPQTPFQPSQTAGRLRRKWDRMGRFGTEIANAAQIGDTTPRGWATPGAFAPRAGRV